MEHLVYCEKEADVLGKLVRGEKTMIVRGAAGRKLPYGRVFENEILYFVVNDGTHMVMAKAVVSHVINSESLNPTEADEILTCHAKALNLSAKQQKRWARKKRYCLVSVEDVQMLEKPFRYGRQGNMDDWITVVSIDEIKEGSKVEYESIRI